MQHLAEIVCIKRIVKVRLYAGTTVRFKEYLDDRLYEGTTVRWEGNLLELFKIFLFHAASPRRARSQIPSYIVGI